MKNAAINSGPNISLWLLLALLVSLPSIFIPGNGYCQESPQTGANDGEVDDDDFESGDDDLGGLLEGLELGPDDGSVPTIPDASENTNIPDSQGPAADGQSSSAENVENGSARSRFAGLAEAFQSMRTAGQLLTAGQTDENVLAAQQRAVDLLDQMIEAQEQSDRQNASRQSQSSDQQTLNQQTGRQADSQQQSADSANQPSPSPGDADQQEDPADPSSDDQNADAGSGETEADRGGTAPASAAGLASPLNAAGQGVWGHLPQKTRGMLRAEIPTDYLPRYSEQISEYFRALAEMSSEQ